MFKKFFLILLSSIFLSLLFISCNKTISKQSSKQTTSSEISDISEDKKVNIAKELFDEYINQNRTDWKLVKDQNLDRNPVLSLTDYKLNDIKFIRNNDDGFTAEIDYDIQYTTESNQWLAGNGILDNDNWIKHKSNLIDIKKAGERYIITNIYTA